MYYYYCDFFLDRLRRLDEFRLPNGKFHLRLVYPEYKNFNEWFQVRMTGN